MTGPSPPHSMRCAPRARRAPRFWSASRKRSGVAPGRTKRAGGTPSRRGLKSTRHTPTTMRCRYARRSPVGRRFHSLSRWGRSRSMSDSVLAGLPRRVTGVEGLRVRGYISTVFGCPYEGEVKPAAVLDVALRLRALGVDEVSLGDTIGVATPNQVVEVTTLLAGHMPIEQLAMHFHDTRGTALANVLASLQLGISVFDSSAAGPA